MSSSALDFDVFVAASARRLLHVAELLAGPAEAEDLVQAVLLRMYLRWSVIAQDDPVAYARRSLANASTDRWRRRRREVLVDEVPDGATRDGPASEDRVNLLRALAGLTARERAVIVLRYYEDLTEKQIAADLGIALGTVKGTGSRALARLRVSPQLSAAVVLVEGAQP